MKVSLSSILIFRLENWSKYPIQSPNMVSLNFGKESSLFPVVGVKPGRAELALLNQVINNHIGDMVD